MQGFVPFRRPMSHLRKELIVNITFLLLANLLIKPYYIFFVERKVQNDAGTGLWGLYFTIFSLSMVPQILLDLGITNYANREIAADKFKYDQFWKTAIWIKPVLAILFLVVFVAISYLGGYYHSFKPLVIWIGFNQILASFILFGRAFISGSGRYRLDSFFSIADKLIFIVLFISAFLMHSLPLDRFLMIQSISMAISVILVIYFVVNSLEKIEFNFEIDFSKVKQIIFASFPYAMVFVLMVLYCRMEPVWIDQLRADGAEQSGHYAAAYRILDAANMMSFLFAGLLLPMFSRSAATDPVEAQGLFDLSWKLMTGLSVLIAIPIVFNHQFIMHFLYPDDHGKILDLVMVNLIPLTINYLMITLITALGKLNQLNKWFLISIGINIVLHFLFTNRLGARGAAWAAVMTQLSTTIVLVIFILKYKLIQFKMQYIIDLSLMIIIGIGVVFLLDKVNVSPWYKLILSCIIFPIFLFITGLIPLKSIFQYLKR